MKKNIIKPYLKGMIKDHFGYLIFNIGLIMLIIVFSYLNFPRFVENQQKITNLTIEVKNLQNKLDTINNMDIKPKDLKTYLEFLNKLIPNTEDYFSIIYSLEEISRKTNFVIQSYAVNLKQSTKDKLKLTISGSGDRTAFVNFLNSYTFEGGRLMTSDKLELNQQLEGALKIDVTFYNKKITAANSDQLTASPDSFQEIANLYNKININIKDEVPTQEYVYPKKSNPF